MTVIFPRMNDGASARLCAESLPNNKSGFQDTTTREVMFTSVRTTLLSLARSNATHGQTRTQATSMVRRAHDGH